jgi:hypothetical protein
MNKAGGKRDKLKKFLWSHQDKKICDTLWVDNLPSNPLTCGGSIASRCTATGHKIKTKMIDIHR